MRRIFFVLTSLARAGHSYRRRVKLAETRSLAEPFDSLAVLLLADKAGPASAFSSLATATTARTFSSASGKIGHGLSGLQMGDAEAKIVMDPFAARNFIKPGQEPDGKAFIDFDQDEFARRANAFYEERLRDGVDPLVPGYAPFCKHLFMPNFVSGLSDSIMPINEETIGLLRTEYAARTEKELPVLTRWFPKDAVGDRLQEATYLDIILYSREQIRKENAAKGNPDINDAPWGIVSVKPQSIDTEIPMEPITMMRNALGREQGGSGVDLERDAYSKSVEFWNAHARVK